MPYIPHTSSNWLELESKHGRESVQMPLIWARKYDLLMPWFLIRHGVRPSNLLLKYNLDRCNQQLDHHHVYADWRTPTPFPRRRKESNIFILLLFLAHAKWVWILKAVIQYTTHLFKHFSSTLLCYYNYNRQSIKAVFGTFFKTTWLKNHFCQSCCMQKNFLSVVALVKLGSKLAHLYLPSCQKGL